MAMDGPMDVATADSEALQELHVFTNDRTSLIQNGTVEHEDDVACYDQLDRARRLRGIRIMVLLSLIFAVAITVAMVVDGVTGNYHTGHGAVASDVKECSDVGAALLKQGGSAVDAAIGAMLCVGVMNPESSGIGGGGFMLVVDSQQQGEVIDFRETAPSRAERDMFEGQSEKARWGILSVAVPGQLRGFELAHKKYGRLEWSKLFAPSIKLAREGFPVKSHTIASLNSTYLKRKILDQKDLSILAQVVAPNGKFLKADDQVKCPALADTLQMVADQGADAFYEGHIADDIVSLMEKHGGIISKEDLKNYHPLVKEAISTLYHGYQVITAPLPAGGLVLASILNILEGFNFTQADQEKAQTYHYIIEAFKLAYAQRTQLGDPFNATSAAELANVVKTMLSKQSARELRQKIRANRTFPAAYYGPFFAQPSDRGTAHLSVLGPDGELVALTSTINGRFGSGVMTDTGVLLNNEMDDFSFPHITNMYGVEPSEANFVSPGKRPLSSCAPTVVLRSQDLCGFRLSVGGVGGTRITTAVAQVLLNMLSFGNYLPDAIERARVHNQLLPNQTQIEGYRMDKNTLGPLIRTLRSFGHTISRTYEPGSDVNGVLSSSNTVSAHADSRRGGQGTAQF